MKDTAILAKSISDKNSKRVSFSKIADLKDLSKSAAEVKHVHVTQPALPPLDEFIPYLEKIWTSRKITNIGQYHQELESALCQFLGVENISLFANGTIALLIALQVLRIQGEVITTPYSFVATTHAIQWNGLKPVFADIDPETLTLDLARVEAAITPQTTAILPVHVYGTPCNVEQINHLADIYGLRVIYDAAHAFGVKIGVQSVLNFGDLSVLSFHGTKIFTTFEGGAIISHDAAMKKRIDFLKNFGFANEVTVVGPGINGKMNEFQAALGLLQLKYFPDHLAKRKALSHKYRAKLDGVPYLRMLPEFPDTSPNYSYFPIFVENPITISKRDEVYERLKQSGYFGRRYFYPLISHFPTYRGALSAAPKNLPVAERISSEVICLPLYSELLISDVDTICDIVRNVLE